MPPCLRPSFGFRYGDSQRVCVAESGGVAMTAQEKAPLGIPTVMVWEEKKPYGTVYRPGNKLGVKFATLVGKLTFTPEQVKMIEDLGFHVVMNNGQPVPIPHPRQKVDVT